MDDLEKKVDSYLNEEYGSNLSHDEILNLCLKYHNDKGLEQVIKLAQDNYGGATFKWELKKSAGLVALNWGVKGIDALYKMSIEKDEYPNVKCVIELFAHIASNEIPLYSKYYLNLSSIKKTLSNYKKIYSEQFRLRSKVLLIELIKKTENDEPFPASLTASIGFLQSYKVQEQIFAALIMRWFHLSSNSLEKYNDLVNLNKVTEQQCHSFLSENPFLLEPFHARIWSKPRCGEFLVPDFVVKSIDNSYTIIEIEEPTKQIFTRSGNLSAHATHAKKQALEYREWFITNHLYATKQFNDVWRPSSLVIIGMEKELSEKHRQRLNQENESTQGILKIVGFDWIYERAKATFENLLKHGFNI